MLKSHRWLPLLFILGAYLALVLWYSLTVPVFEAPDESSHYQVIELMSTTGRLPVLDHQEPGEEEHQPPLYYALAVPILRLTNAGSYGEFTVRNPHAAISAVESLGNKNVFLHGNPAERWPFQGVPRAVHLIRLVSMALGALTVVATYGIALKVFGETRFELAAASAAVVAFTPQFVFISGAINNDVAVAALCTVVLWLVILYDERAHSVRWLVALGAAGGLASLTKAAGLASIVLIVAGLALKAMQTRQFGRLWKDILVVAVVSSIVGGWWYLRNLVLYDDPFLARYITQWFSGDRVPQTAMQLLERYWESLPSYWGVFGWLNIAWPEWVYHLLRLATMAAGVGLIIFAARLFRSREQDIHRKALAMVLLWTMLALAAISRWILIAGGLQGRLLFPAIGSLSILLVLGWSSLVPRPWYRYAAAVPVGALLVLSLATPLWIIAPAYALPPRLDLEQARERMTPTSLRIGDRAELVGYRTDPSAARPGDTIKVILYWHVLGPIEHDFSVFVKLFGRDAREIGVLNSYPGLGNFPTSRWQAGQVIEDVYPVRIAGDAEVPVLAAISVGWYDSLDRYAVEQTDPQGNPTSFVGHVKLVPTQWPPAPAETLANFADQIHLADYEIEQSDRSSLRLRLEWVSQSSPDRDLTVFAHVVDEQGQILAQQDQPPLAGGYPTSFWGEGEVIHDWIAVPLPADWDGSEAAAINVGLYDSVTGERLPVLDESGHVGDDSVALPLVKH